MNQCEICMQFLPEDGKHKCRNTTVEVRAAITDLRDSFGYPPTMQEIADYLGLSKSTVHRHVRKLARAGAIALRPHRHRTMEIRP